MTIQPQDASLIIDTKHSTETWCIFEHQAVLNEGEPPTVILIGAAKLVDVFRLIDGKSNSEWATIFERGGSILLRIVGTTMDKAEAQRTALARMRDTNPTPRCNLHGYNLRGNARAIICLNNQKRYDTQRAAADDLGIHSSSISRHLAGEITHAQGFRFAYAPEPRKESA